MLRRHFLKLLAGTPFVPAAARASQPAQVLLQQSPLAGFQYHAAGRLWHGLTVGDPLSLQREPDNRHDRRAVAVYWQGHKLGYLPRVENTAASQLLDRKERLSAQIGRLSEHRDPWKRVELAVYLKT